MKLLKPHWICHGGNPIFSLSIHPDGTRVATGGQGKDSGIVVIWNTDPIRSVEMENDVSVPKMLCELTNHLGCVNCVKWSNDGKWLASSGDDAIIMLWNLRFKGISAPAFGSDNPTHEQWGCGFMLRGHSGDVQDISWSHDNKYLASASVDNSIIIWNALKFPEQVAVLTSHTGLVKGLTWDPVGKYLASQSDDKSILVWRTTDWKEETRVSRPFQNCGGTTHVLRLSWSPDGRFIVSAHSLNNDGPTAHIIERSSWKTGMDFVGHRKAIEVVSFNPQLFTKTSSEDSSNHGCIAIGSRDRSVSVWLTSLKRPLIVVHDLFNNSVLDLAWSKDGYTLMACSLDGTCAFLSFTEKELGMKLDREAINNLFVDLYGTKRFGGSSLATESQDLLVEDPAMLMHSDTQTNNLSVANAISTPPRKDSLSVLTSSVSSSSQQIETRTKDGRRRITPITLTSEPSYISMQSTPFSSPQTVQTPKKKDPATLQHSQSLLSVAMTGTAEHKTPVKSPPAKPISFAPLSPEPKEPKDTTQSLTAAKAIITRVKRPSLESGQDSTNAVKQKRMKKAKATDDVTPSSTKSLKNSVSLSARCLPIPTIDTPHNTSVSLNDVISAVEVNNISSNCTVSCIQKDIALWSVSFPSPALVTSSSHLVTCVCLEDHTAVILSTLTGRQLFPRFVLSCSPYSVFVNSHFVGIATIDATLTVYDVSSFRSVVSNVSFSHLFDDATDITRLSITDDGLPLLFTHKQVYCYNCDMQTWIQVVSTSEHSIIHSTKFTMSSTITELTPLRSLQHSVGLSAFSSRTPPATCSATLSYLESQIGRSLCLQSVLECRHWIKCYVRYLVSETLEERLREFMSSLLPRDVSLLPAGSSSSHVSSYCTPSFLQECLAIVTSNTKLQRLYCELRDNINMS